MTGYMGEFIALAVIHFLAVMAPGPDFAVTTRQSVRHGRSAGIGTAIGIGAGISVHVIYTLLGVGALMQPRLGYCRWPAGWALLTCCISVLYLSGRRVDKRKRSINHIFILRPYPLIISLPYFGGVDYDAARYQGEKGVSVSQAGGFS